MAVQPLIPLANHYDGVHDHRSACRNLHNAVLELPTSFFRVCVRVCNLEEFADGLGPLAVKFGAQLLTVMESSGENGDGLTV